MKFYGEKSFSSFMYKLSKVLFWFMLLPLFMAFSDLISKTTYVSEISSGMFSIVLPDGVVNTHTSKFMMFFVMPILMIFCKVSINLFDNFRKNIIFDKRNLKFLKFLALLEISLGIFTSIDEFLNYRLAMKYIEIPRVNIDYSLFDNMGPSLELAIVYIMIAVALEKAIEYKEENELTV